MKNKKKDFLLSFNFILKDVSFTNAINVQMCPQLELQSTGPSTPSIITDEDGNVIDHRDSSSEPIQFVFEDIHWTSEISWQEAARRLDVTFYPFKKVNTPKLLSRHTAGFNATNTLLSFVLPPRCPTCLSQRPLNELKQRINWCIPFCFGEH